MVGRPEVPRKLGNYTLGEVLGRGGMGTVYRAKADGSDEAVALKVLLPELAQDLEYLKRFRREIKAGSRLTCPYVVHIVGWGEDQGYFYFAMELLENGKDLARVLEDDDKIKTSLALDVGIQLCQALDELHRTGVVHRDIKPGNIMLLPNNTIKLMDFGLAKMLDRTALTATGEALGSPRYMSPEILKGLPADYRSDVYQVGVLLYELISGEPAFDGESFDRLLHLILETEAIDLSTLCPNVSHDVASVIRTCMRKSPTDRYKTAKELQANLEAVKEGRPPLPPFSGKVSGKSDVGPRASSHASKAAELDHTDAVKTRRVPTASVTPQKMMALLFFLVMALVAIVLTRQPPAAIDPNVQVTKGFQSVEVRWRTAHPCATRARTRIGKGPIKEYTNAVETKTKEHTILLKNLQVGKPYKVKLQGTRGPYRAPIMVELEKPSPPSAVRVNRRGNTIAVEAAFPLRVRAALTAYTLGRAYRSEPEPGGELSMLIRSSISGIPAYADVSRLELLLTDRFGTTKSYPLEAQPGTVALLLMSRDAAGRPLDAAVKEFAPTAAKFFTDKNVAIEQKADVYRALLRAEAKEGLYAPFVSWHRATEVLANGAPTARPRMAKLPLRLKASTTSKLVGEGKLFAIHLEETPVAGRQAFLCFSRSELPPDSKLHILVGDGFEIQDSILRPAGEWFVKFPAGLLGQRRLAMVRFVLVGKSGSSVRIDSVGLQTP